MPLSVSLGGFFHQEVTLSDALVKITSCSTFVIHIPVWGSLHEKFSVHCNSLLSFDSVMCIIMRTATCNIIFSSSDLKAQFSFTDHCSFVVRMSAKLFLEKNIHKWRTKPFSKGSSLGKNENWYGVLKKSSSQES